MQRLRQKITATKINCSKVEHISRKQTFYKQRKYLPRLENANNNVFVQVIRQFSLQKFKQTDYRQLFLSTCTCLRVFKYNKFKYKRSTETYKRMFFCTCIPLRFCIENTSRLVCIKLLFGIYKYNYLNINSFDFKINFYMLNNPALIYKKVLTKKSKLFEKFTFYKNKKTNYVTTGT